MKTVAVDFDGVVHAYSRGWQDGSIYDEPVPGAFDAIRALQDAGTAVYIHTSRDPDQVWRWLVERMPEIGPVLVDPAPDFWNDDRHVLVTRLKLPAVAYVDDRGVRFQGDWTETLSLLDELEGVM